ncbi:MAG: hypothetical protein QOG62_2477 [Thermoleophilaceae bacterium]|nr:hypothetical protein [Thermoleophilaceae bacterium]
MRSTPWTNEHDQLLTEAAPDAAVSDDAELDRVWNCLAAEIATDVPPRRRRRRRVVAAVAVGAVVFGSSSLAVADLYSAHTGKGPADSEDVRLGGPGERLDPAAPE